MARYKCCLLTYDGKIAKFDLFGILKCQLATLLDVVVAVPSSGKCVIFSRVGTRHFTRKVGVAV